MEPLDGGGRAGGEGGFPRMPSSHSLSSPLPLPAWRQAVVSEGMGTDEKEKHTGITSLLCRALPVSPHPSFPAQRVQLF